jgi:hypothetical protein
MSPHIRKSKFAQKAVRVWTRPINNNKSKRFKLDEDLLVKKLFSNFDWSDYNSCWNWTGTKNSELYGTYNTFSASGMAHVIVYCFFRGDYDFNKLELDHLCRNHSCVNPKHLEPVTHRTNVMRGFAPTVVNHKLYKLYRELKSLEGRI